MKVVILAAGMGTRVRPLTHIINKTLIPIHGQPFMSYTIDDLLNIGVKQKDIFIVAKYKLEQIYNFVENYYPDVNVIIQPDYNGTGGAVESVIQYIQDDNFLVLNGDNYYGIDVLETVVENYKDNELNAMFTFETDYPERYGIMSYDQDNNPIRIIEKPQLFIGNQANSGMYVFNTEMLYDIISNSSFVAHDKKELYITDVCNYMLDNNIMNVEQIHRPIDLGKLEDIRTIEEELI